MQAVLALAALCCALLAWAANDAQMIDAAMQRYGTAGATAVRDWRALVASLPGKAEELQLRSVNDFFNRRVRFADDQEIWNQPDYWATPIETLGRGAGDCEDFALAKYFSLREAGVDAAKLRLIYVRARIGGPDSSITQAHMVVGYYATPDAEPQVLDNLIGDIRPASRRPDLSPVFSFNSEGVYAGGSVSSIERLTRWKGLLLRMRSEGYAPQ